MLVVVHHRYVELCLESTFYFEALGCFDIFEVNAAKGGCYGFYGLNKSFGVFLVDFDVEHIDAAVDFKEQSFTLHHRFSAHGTYIAEAENCRAVADYCH